MRLLKTKPFSRWARKEGLRDRVLREAAEGQLMEIDGGESQTA